MDKELRKIEKVIIDIQEMIGLISKMISLIPLGSISIELKQEVINQTYRTTACLHAYYKLAEYRRKLIKKRILMEDMLE